MGFIVHRSPLVVLVSEPRASGGAPGLRPLRHRNGSLGFHRPCSSLCTLLHNYTAMKASPRTCCHICHLVSATQNRAGGSGDAAYQSHNHDIDNAYTDSVIYTDTLKPGMYVAIMPMLINDRIQQYIILDEIVRIDGHG